MSDEINDLITEARRWANGHPNRRSGELMRDLADALEAAPRERDAAVAAIERVRLVVDSHRSVEQHNEMVPISDIADLIREPSSADYLAALDGAPEPQDVWEYRCTNSINTTGLLADPALHARQCSGKIERRRKAGPWIGVEGEKP